MADYIPPVHKLVQLINGLGNWRSLVDILARLDPAYIEPPPIDRSLGIQSFRYSLAIAESKIRQDNLESAREILDHLATNVPVDEEIWFFEVCVDLAVREKKWHVALAFCEEALNTTTIKNFLDSKNKFLNIKEICTLASETGPLTGVQGSECRPPKKKSQSEKLIRKNSQSST